MIILMSYYYLRYLKTNSINDVKQYELQTNKIFKSKNQDIYQVKIQFFKGNLLSSIYRLQ